MENEKTPLAIVPIGITKTAENIVQLSFDQEKLMGELKGINPNNPGYIKLAKDQKKLKDDASLIEDSLFALSKRVVEIEPFINREINKINNGDLI